MELVNNSQNLIGSVFKGVRGLVYDRTFAPLIYLRLKNRLDTIYLGYVSDLTTPEKIASGANLFFLKQRTSNPLVTNEKLMFSTPYVFELLETLITCKDPYLQVATSWIYEDYLTTSETVVNPFFEFSATDTLFTIYAKNLFSDKILLDLCQNYFNVYSRSKETVTYDNFKDYLSKATSRDIRHLTLWVAYFLVEKRRVLEFSESKNGLVFTNSQEMGEIPTLGNGKPDFTMTVAVGDVFSLFDNVPEKIENSNKVGAENIFGDNNGYWWKYQLYLRMLFEREFQDYSLRTSEMFVTQLNLEKLSWYNSHYLEHPHNFNFFPNSKL